MARVLWYGDAGCHTGFATVTESIGNRLVTDFGHDVHVLALNYRGDYWPGNLKLYPPAAFRSDDNWGLSRVQELLERIDPEVVVILNDPNVVLNTLIHNQYDVERELLRRKLVFYLPVDGYRLPLAWDALKLAGTRVAMSKFGQAAMEGSELIYHGVDPAPEIDRKEAKKALGYDPERFLILRVDKNSLRKNYGDTWRAIRPLLRKYDDIDAHFHCLPDSPDGISIRAFLSPDEDIRDRVNFSAGLGGFIGWSQETLGLLYAAADVFVSTSYGEGFGLTIAEAMAHGTPVVAQDASAISEVVGPGGYVVKPARAWTAPMGQEQMLPDIDGFTYYIEKLYRSRKLREELGRAGRQHVLETFSWDRAAEQFDSLITKLASPVQTSPDVSPAAVGS